jgi:hypothetical protein
MAPAGAYPRRNMSGRNSDGGGGLALAVTDLQVSYGPRFGLTGQDYRD